MNQNFRVVVNKNDLDIITVFLPESDLLIPKYDSIAFFEDRDPLTVGLKWESHEFECYDDNIEKTLSYSDIIEFLKSAEQIIVYDSGLYYLIEELIRRNTDKVGLLLSFVLNGLRITTKISPTKGEQHLLRFEHPGIY